MSVFLCPMPQFRHTDPVKLYFSIPVDTGFVDVVGDGANGSYEFVIRREDGSIENLSDVGYGSPEIALRDGLILYTTGELQP